MKRFLTIVSISLLAVFLLSACQEDGEVDTATDKDGKLQVVTSFTIIEDMVKRDGIDGVILGCTELPMIIKEDDLELPQLNTTQIHIDRIIELMFS